jgi:transposase InsO family protein
MQQSLSNFLNKKLQQTEAESRLAVAIKQVELKAEIFDYIEVFYNKVRRHSYLNYLSPVEFEQQQIGH